MGAMNELISNTLTLTFKDEEGRHYSEAVCATVEVVDAIVIENPGYLENIATSHK